MVNSHYWVNVLFVWKREIQGGDNDQWDKCFGGRRSSLQRWDENFSLSGRKGCHLHVRRLNDDLLSELCQNHNPFFYLILIHDRWMSKDEEASMRASLQPDDFPVCDYPIRKPGKVTLFKTLLVWRRKITKLLNIYVSFPWMLRDIIYSGSS